MTKIISTAFAGTVLLAFIIFSMSQLMKPKDLGIKDFRMQSPTGFVNLHDYKGKVVLIYFGFLTCPEACPATFANVATAFKRLTPEELENVVLLYITLDPERDTLYDMKVYSEYFHQNIIPLHSDLEYIKKVTKYYKARFRKVELDKDNYTIDHTLDLIVLDRENDIHKVIVQGEHGHNSKYIHNVIQSALAALPKQSKENI